MRMRVQRVGSKCFIDTRAGESEMAKNAKSKSKGTKARKRRPVVVRDAVGIISTISITREMKQAINNGLANPGVRLKFSYVGSYKPNKMKNKFKKFNNNNNIKLVLTLGGNKTYEAAVQFSQKPFVSMAGITPNAPPALCKGGINLNSTGGNQARVDHLTGLGKTKSKIGLLCNQNSAMNAAEEQDWKNNINMPAGNIFHAGKDTTADENDTDTYDAAFTNIKAAGMQAVIVSADPFFQETMDELVADANDSGVYITYPLQDYNKAWEPPTMGNATLQGPDLLMAYSQLGAVAATALTGGTPGFLSANSATNDI
jgi:hypothetical protein